MGDIPLSTNMLAETFEQDSNAVIEERKEFFEGVTLKYKIYRHRFELNSPDYTIGFQSTKKNDFISNLFARP